MSQQVNTVYIPYRNGKLYIPRCILDEYARDLIESPHFSSVNVEVHMRFLYSGNLLVVHEFLAWYNEHEEFDELCFVENDN